MLKYMVKQLMRDGQSWWLMPANSAYQPYKITNPDGIYIWGVVTYVVRELVSSRLHAFLHLAADDVLGRKLQDAELVVSSRAPKQSSPE